MGTYDIARSKTTNAIIQAFWELYAEKDIWRITVRDITEKIGIHRATFYLYFDNVYAVLDVIKSEQLDKVANVCSTYTSSDNEYAEFLNAMHNLYQDNKNFLSPLLSQFRDNSFSIQCRKILKNKLRKDIGWSDYPEESVSFFITDSVLSGLIETFLSCLQSDKITLQQSFHLAYGSVNNGIAPTMQKVFGIHSQASDNLQSGSDISQLN